MSGRYDVLDEYGGKIGEVREAPDYERRAAEAAGTIAAGVAVGTVAIGAVSFWWILTKIPIVLTPVLIIVAGVVATESTL